MLLFAIALIVSPYSENGKEEAFLIRRIAEFWKDQDYQIVKAQIADFLTRYPHSKMTDYLLSLQGDIFLQESAYQTALESYNQIQSPEIINKIVINKLQSLYELGLYEPMIQEGNPYIGKTDGPLENRLTEFTFLMAEAYFRGGDKEKAIPLYETLLDTPYKDPSMFALAELYQLTGQGQKAATLFRELATLHLDLAEDLLFQTALAEAKFDKELAIDTFTKISLKNGVKAKDAALNRFLLEETKESLLLKGKLCYEQGNYQEALPLLHKCIALYPEDASLSEAHFFIALCHLKLQSPPELFSLHAEKAVDENKSLHLELYNTYLKLHQEEKAASHLFSAIKHGDTPIKLENKMWLAHYYLKQGLIDKAAFLLENGLIPNGQLIPLAAYEKEVLELASLKNGEEKIKLIQALIEVQTENPHEKWRFQKEALLELAKTYDLIGNHESAYETFQFLTSHFPRGLSFATECAALHATRLKFALLPENQKIETTCEVINILTALKGWQIRKTPSTEPIHLEAALEYAQIRAELVQGSDKEKALRYLFFLNRIKEDYNDMNDPIVQNYHKALKEDDAKMKLYATYQKFIDAEILRCQSILTESTELSHQSEELLMQFINSSSYYLKLRSERSYREVNYRIKN